MASPKQRLFITGGTGYIGSVVVEFAIADGYEVHALSRSESGDTKLRGLGAVPIRGDLTSLDVLRNESGAADIVIHIATSFKLGEHLSFDDAIPIDMAAANAIAEPLFGTGKALVTTSGTLAAAADPNGAETDEQAPLSTSPVSKRVLVDQHTRSFADKGVRVSNIRLAPYVYGRGGSGVALFMGMAAQTGAPLVAVDGGKNYTTIVHVDDAARLYLLAARKAKAGEVYNASAATAPPFRHVTVRQIFDAAAAIMGSSVVDVPYADAKTQMGEFVAWFLGAESKASGAKAVKELGWQPREVDILDDIKSGSYLAVAERLSKPKA